MDFPMVWNVIDRIQHIFKKNPKEKRFPNFLWGVYNTYIVTKTSLFHYTDVPVGAVVQF